MNGNSQGVVLSPGGLAGAERSKGSPFEPQRSAAAAQAGADAARVSRPDSEVVAKAKRRTFTAEYKLQHPAVTCPSFCTSSMREFISQPLAVKFGFGTTGLQAAGAGGL